VGAWHWAPALLPMSLFTAAPRFGAPAAASVRRSAHAPRPARHAGARLISRASATPSAPTVTLKVDGMICSKCSDRVRNVLAAQAGVAAATADHAAGAATAAPAPGASLDAAALAAAVTDAGFDAVPA